VQTPRPAAARSRWLIWDPHEKLWTWTTVGAVRRVFGDNPLGRGILGAVVTADSVLLLTRVLARRVQLVAAGEGRAPSGKGPRPRVLYVDCGVHKEGRQIRAVHAWLGDRYDLTIVGIEAGSEHVEDARSALADVGGVELRHVALVGPDHEGETVRLYTSGGLGRGKGDSLFAARGSRHEDVPAARLSRILVEGGYLDDDTVVVLRMNIEGAEQYVIADLLDSGLDARVDGYYGMWDDVAKIDPDADRAFRAVLRRSGIVSVTFNDRDMPHRLRRFAIRTDLETTVRRGWARRRRPPSPAR